MHCKDCGHEHEGFALASICIGCPCPETPGLDSSTEEEGDDLTCRECGLTYQLEDGKEPCEYCYGCVYNVLDRCTAERDALAAQVADLQCTQPGKLTALVAERDALKAEVEQYNAMVLELAAVQEELAGLGADNERLRAENAKPGSNRHVAWLSGWAQGCEEVRNILEPQLTEFREAVERTHRRLSPADFGRPSSGHHQIMVAKILEDLAAVLAKVTP